MTRSVAIFGETLAPADARASSETWLALGDVVAQAAYPAAPAAAEAEPWRRLDEVASAIVAELTRDQVRNRSPKMVAKWLPNNSNNQCDDA
jgi:hypothetical protein